MLSKHFMFSAGSYVLREFKVLLAGWSVVRDRNSTSWHSSSVKLMFNRIPRVGTLVASGLGSTSWINKC